MMLRGSFTLFFKWFVLKHYMITMWGDIKHKYICSHHCPSLSFTLKNVVELSLLLACALLNLWAKWVEFMQSRGRWAVLCGLRRAEAACCRNMRPRSKQLGSEVKLMCAHSGRIWDAQRRKRGWTVSWECVSWRSAVHFLCVCGCNHQAWRQTSCKKSSFLEKCRGSIVSFTRLEATFKCCRTTESQLMSCL